nr:replication/maintenance protein RepL [Motilibacter aurantiacus]
MTLVSSARHIAAAKLPGAAGAVLWALLGELRPAAGNVVTASWSRLAQTTTYDRKTVGAALRALEEAELLAKLPTDGRATASYMVNPRLIFCGGTEARRDAVRLWKTLHGEDLSHRPGALQNLDALYEPGDA